MFDVRTVIKLVNAGFSAEEIEDILAPKDTNGSATTPAAATPTPTPAAATPTPTPEAATLAPTPAAATLAPTPAAAEPTPAAVNIDDLKNTVNEGFKSIIEALQVSAVGGSSQNMPVAKTSEDILAEIISPFDK